MRSLIILTFFVALLFSSCGDESPQQTIPYARVSFRIELDGYDNILKNPLSYKVFTEKDRRFQSDSFGIGGILVVSDAGGALHAFDLCCPHEHDRTILVDAEYEGRGIYNGKVKCPSCGSVFVTMFGLGSVESGPSAQPLQRYVVHPLSDGNYRVVN